MRAYGIPVPGSVVTRKTAPGYLRELAEFLHRDGFDLTGDLMYTEVAQHIIDAGLMTWEETEEVLNDVIPGVLDS